MDRYQYLLFILPVFLFYQNCGQSGEIALESHVESAKNAIADPISAPTTNSLLVAITTPEIVKELGSSVVEIKYKNLTTINVLCQDKAKTKNYINTTANLANSSEGIISMPLNSIASDIHCEFQGHNFNVVNFIPLKTKLQIQIDCQNRVKNQSTGSCEDFKCLKTQALSLNDLIRIPARTSEGICYTVKLMSKISNSSSTLNSTRDTEVQSRNHDQEFNDPTDIQNPYIMDKFKAEINILGERVVKLTGADSSSANILVDNFILTGIYPVSTNESLSDLAKNYKVRGTTDSSLIMNGQYGVLFRETLLPVISFGPLGTSSVAPIDISTEITPNVPHNIDIRALDCGGSRELSDIYLLFQ